MFGVYLPFFFLFFSFSFSFEMVVVETFRATSTVVGVFRFKNWSSPRFDPQVVSVSVSYSLLYLTIISLINQGPNNRCLAP